MALKKLTKHIIQALVDRPELINISEVEGKQVTVLEIKAAKEDLGKIIGKQGRNAKAIRAILNAASAKTKRRTIMEIVE